MRLVLKDEKYAFTVTKAAEPKTEFGSEQQKMNRASKLPEWTVEVLAMDSERGETSDAVKLSSCLADFLPGDGEGDGFVVVLAGGQAMPQAAEQAAEQVALGGGVPVAVVAAAVVVGAGAG